jgi:histidinol-phosphate aminotransferase
MSTDLHPLARPSLHKLKLPGVYGRREPPRIDLGSNTNPYAGPPGTYPEIVPRALSERYREWLAESEGIKLGDEQLIFTVGSSGALTLLLDAFAEPGRDRICVTPPTFPMYAHWAISRDVEVVAVPLAGADLDRLEVDRIIAAAAKLTILCSPGNPVGSPLRREQVEELLARTQGIVVVDEAYWDYSGERSWIGDLARHPHLVVLRTFSKAWGLASVRAGVALAHPSVIRALRLVLSPFSLSTPAIQGVHGRLARANEVQAEVRRTQVEREWLREALGQIPGVTKIFKSSANFLLVRFGEAGPVLERLDKAGIAVGDARAVVAECLRVTLGKREENEELLRVLKS